MSHKSQKHTNKKQYNHPVFLIDDQSQNNSQTQCLTCCQYEQDINLLQQKLMQTHNKLIQQIDVCRQQQIKIMKLNTSNVGQFGKDIQNNTNIGNIYPRSQQNGKIYKKTDDQYIHSIQPLIEAKTQLLRNDLQAMRAKVLSEILKSNKLKQQNRQIEIKHEKQIQQFRQKIKKIESSKNKLVDQNQKLFQQIQNMRKQTIQVKAKCNCGYQQKYFELDKAFMNQRVVTNQLIQENNTLQNRIHQLHQNQVKSGARGYYNQGKGQHKVEEIRTSPKKRRGENREKFKQQFQATKNLIKKLQEAQLQIRNKHYDRS